MSEASIDDGPVLDSGSRSGSVAVLAKAMATLELLSDEGEVKPAHIAEMIDQPRSTVYRLLSSLRDLGYVESGSQHGTYRLSLKLLDLGNRAVERLDERGAALPVMQRLHDAIGETIFLCVRRGFEAVCIERIEGARVMLLELRLGGSLPLHLGAASQCLLAFEPEETWDAYFDSISLKATAMTQRSAMTRAEVIAQLRDTRTRGYAISDRDVTPGIVSIGAPVYDHTRKVRASLSVGGLREVVTEASTHVPDLIVDGAAEVSKALGYRP